MYYYCTLRAFLIVFITTIPTEGGQQSITRPQNLAHTFLLKNVITSNLTKKLILTLGEAQNSAANEATTYTNTLSIKYFSKSFIQDKNVTPDTITSMSLVLLNSINASQNNHQLFSRVYTKPALKSANIPHPHFSVLFAERLVSQFECRDRFGSLENPVEFLLRSCFMCFRFLFITFNSSDVHALLNRAFEQETGNISYISDDLLPNKLRPVCSTKDLGESECRRWIECCTASNECCRQQQKQEFTAEEGKAYCPSTWDGVKCWVAAEEKTEASQSCPSYMEHALLTRKAVKTCLENGTWFARDGFQWTNYAPCLNYEMFLSLVYTCIIFNVISFACLLPSIGIFSCFRQLYKQTRIKIHINFFIALLIFNVCNILWYSIIHLDMLSKSDNTETYIYQNPLLCRVLAMLKLYSTFCTYFWMLCEGSYLHRLLSRALEQNESALVFYLLGWACPFFPTLIYTIMRTIVDNTSCWVNSIGNFEWLIYTPNLICLILNLLLLLNILRILLFQLNTHPHEPGHFRRCLKAVAMLTPLFGLQLLLTIYRPDVSGAMSGANEMYEHLTVAVTNSQGIFVSLIFCFLNDEVHSHVCRCIRKKRNLKEVTTTQFTLSSLDQPRKSVLELPLLSKGSKKNLTLLTSQNKSENNLTVICQIQNSS